MSSYLRSAAMGLLSRMVQALLSKYLSDVDVDGIAIPSMISSNNDSGFGMRLSNVKLRYGAKLMQLPGLLRQRRQPKRQPKQQRQRQPKQQPRTNTTAKQQQQQQQHAPDNVHHLHSNSSHQRQTELNNNYNVEFSHQRHQTISDTSRIGQNIDTFPQTTTTTTEHDDINSMAKFDSEKQSFINPTSQTKQQHHSTKKKKVGWLSSWFTTTNELDSTTSTSTSTSTTTTTIRPNKPYVRSSIPLDVSVNDCENGSPMWVQPTPQAQVQAQSTTTTSTTSSSATTDNNPLTKQSIHNVSSMDEHNSNNVKSNCQQIDEPNLILQLGKDCVIGTLDVRLIGKAIHVLIENVVLNLDVVRPSIPKEIIDSSTSNLNGTTNTSTNTTTATPQPQPPPKEKTTSTTTTSDRVVAENALARFLSLLPNLCLRNVHVRLHVRYDSNNNNNNNDDDVHQNTTSHQDTQQHTCNDTTVVEINIDMLTVTDGDDFLSKLRSNLGDTDDDDEDDDNNNDNNDEEEYDEEDDYYDDDDNDDDIAETDSCIGGLKHTKSNMSVATSSIFPDESNDYITRRIRTGRGEGKANNGSGIIIRVHPAQSNYVNCIHPRIHRLSKLANQQQQQQQWARERFLSDSDRIMLRCTGLDLQAQIFVGTKKSNRQQQQQAAASGSSTASLPYDDVMLDSMISGCVDYVVPGPNTSLPPMFTNAESVAISEIEGHDSFTYPGNYDGAVPSLYTTDANGIQSCRIPSIFHKVSRGLIPDSTHTQCLPCEDNVIKWIKPGSVDHGHPLDDAIPLPGLVLQISIKDCLEINADRQNLEALGDVLALFKKKSSVSESKPNKNNDSETQIKDSRNDDVDDDDQSETSVTSARTEVSLFCKSPIRETIVFGQPEEPVQDEVIDVVVVDSDKGFPSYMQPEKIQILGVYIAKTNLRIHCMRDSTCEIDAQNGDIYANETGVSFSYWQADASCLTMDMQTLNSSERPFQDIRLDVSYLKIIEYKGTCKRLLVNSIGRDREFGNMPNYHANADDSYNTNTRSQWPSTAAALLEIPPPMESVKYETRKDHALQLRYVNITNSLDAKNVIRRYLIANIQNVAVDAPFPIWRQIPEIIGEVTRSVLGRGVPPPLDKRLDSRLKFSIRFNGGHVYLEPLINATVPIPVVVDGELSSLCGFSVQTVINNAKVHYGTCTRAPVLENGLTLQQLAELPETVRLRILLFLQDLTPLEVALGIHKIDLNPFRRQRNVNRAIVKVAQSVPSKSSINPFCHTPANGMSTTTNNSNNRRLMLLTELSKLDDDMLESFLKHATSTVLLNERTCSL